MLAEDETPLTSIPCLMTILYATQRLPGNSGTAAVKKELARLSRSPEVNGVMLELPLPSHLTAHRQELWAAIDPEKASPQMFTTDVQLD